MGITIQYNGKLRDPEQVEDLVEEVRENCEILDWEYNLFDDTIDQQRIRGIIVSTGNSEPIFLTFDDEGRLVSPVKLVIQLDIPVNLLPSVNDTTSEHADPYNHAPVIKLLEYLRDKYFEEMEIHDDVESLETKDVNLVKLKFSELESSFQQLGAALSNLEHIEGETSDELATRVEKLLLEKFGSNEIARPLKS